MKQYFVELSRKKGESLFSASNSDGHGLSVNGLCDDDKGKGISPMEMLLVAAGGCAGIDILSMLKDEADMLHVFDINVSGSRDSDETPAYFRKVELNFIVEGNVSSERIIRCIELSLEKYCTVGKTLEAFAEVSWKLKLNGEVHASEAVRESS